MKTTKLILKDACKPSSYKLKSVDKIKEELNLKEDKDKIAKYLTELGYKRFGYGYMFYIQ